MILLKSSNTSVFVTSNIPSVHFNVGEQLTSIDEIAHLIAIQGEEQIFIDFGRESVLAIGIGIV